MKDCYSLKKRTVLVKYWTAVLTWAPLEYDLKMVQNLPCPDVSLKQRKRVTPVECGEKQIPGSTPPTGLQVGKVAPYKSKKHRIQGAYAITQGRRDKLAVC